ncbi:MAG: hypothetical protein IKO00_14020 [Oscillospiraceae bacterium]|nr:hypothetical protein [Oscillospiraceae bacterium]
MTKHRSFGAMLLAILLLMSMFSTVAFASDYEGEPTEDPVSSDEPVEPPDEGVVIEVIPETESEHTEHSFAAISWASLNAVEHEVCLECSVCGVLETVTESHELAFSDWIAVSDTEHQREKSCLCGFFDYETAPHRDDDGDCFCDDCGYQVIRRFSVTVPAYLPIAVSETGAVTTAANAKIINSSAGTVMVSDIWVSGENGWSVVPYSRNMASEKVDSKQIGLMLNNAETEMIGVDNTCVLELTEYEWIIAPDTALPLTYDAVISAISRPIIGETVLTLYFVVGWAPK